MPTSAPSLTHQPQRQLALRPQARRGHFLSLAPLLLVFYSFLLLPPEAEMAVFGVNLPSYRLALIAMMMPALWKILRRPKGPINPIDVAVAIMAFWIILSFTTNYSFGSGLVRGTGILIDVGLSYLVARACIRSPDDLRYFLLLVLPGLLFAGAFLAIESLSGRILLRPFFVSIFGAMDAFAGGDATGVLVLEPEFRLGLLRAYGPFPHPILAGAVMLGFLPLYYFSGLRSWPYVLGVAVTLTGFFALSSAAVLSLLVALGAIAIYHVKPYFPKISWWTIIGLLALIGWALHVGSKSGIISVISRLTLTPHTADYRLLIWEYGAKSVAKHPWFGIGYRQWERLNWMTGDSVDAHFLLLAMRHGLLVPVILLAAIIYGMVRLGRVVPLLPPKDRAFGIGLNIAMMSFVMVGQTVAYFGSANLVFMSFVAFLASTVSWCNQQINAQRLALGQLCGSNPLRLA